MLPALKPKPPECKGCLAEFINEGFAHHSGPSSSPIMMIGEALGEVEAREGIPFWGGTGQMLCAMIRQAGITDPYITNIVKCRPWEEGANKHVRKNRTPNQSEIDRCTNTYLRRELETTSPILIIPVGDTAMRWVFTNYGQSTPGNITNIRGYVFNVQDPISKTMVKVLPIVHPSYIAQGNPEYWSITVHDLKKAKQEATSRTTTETPERFIIGPSVQTVRNTIRYIIDHKLPFSLDLETLGLNIYDINIMCIGIGWSSSDAICIPILKRGGYPYWTDSEEYEVWYEIYLLLGSQCTKITQNGFPFDLPILRYLGCKVFGRCEDTLTQHHTVALELPHSLEFLASTYTRQRVFKGEAKGPGSMLWRKNEDLWTYNCRDCTATWTSKFELDKELDEMEMKVW
jgi:uracil-DNA glycosylase family 4